MLRADSARIDWIARNSLLLVMLGVITAVLLSLAGELLVADSWMTLVAGREIVQHGLPDTEALTQLAAGREWVDQQWLAQLAFYGAWALGGLKLAILLNVALISAAFVSAVWFARARGGSARSTLFCASVCAFVAPWAWQLRAQSFALPLFVWVVGLLSLDPRLERRRTLLVLPLLVLWGNFHGSALLGAGLASLAGLLALAGRLRTRAAPVTLWRPALFALAPWPCLVMSPYFLELPGYYRLLLVDSPVSKVIVEWQAPKPRDWLLIFFAVAALTIVVAVWQRRRLSLFDLAVLAACLAGALRSGRGVVWFAVAVAILLPVALDGALGGDKGPVRRGLGVALVGFAGVFVLAALIAVVVRPESKLERGWPPRALEAIRAATADGPTKAVWPSDKHGDWILWKVPEVRGRVAYDVRFELSTPDELRDFVVFKSLTEGWERVPAGYATLVLDRGDTPRHLAKLEALGWRRLYVDDTMAVLGNG